MPGKIIEIWTSGADGNADAKYAVAHHLSHMESGISSSTRGASARSWLCQRVVRPRIEGVATVEFNPITQALAPAEAPLPRLCLSRKSHYRGWHGSGRRTRPD